MEKRRDKEARQAQRATRKEEEILARHEILKEAKHILLQHQHAQDICSAKLKVRHLKSLLISHGVSASDIKKKKRGELLIMYWDRHVDETFPAVVDMKVARYFDEDLYCGVVESIENDKYNIIYDDGDRESMDIDQLQYANALYKDEFVRI